MYLVMTTLTEVFKRHYHISQGPISLVFLGIDKSIPSQYSLCINSNILAKTFKLLE